MKKRCLAILLAISMVIGSSIGIAAENEISNGETGADESTEMVDILNEDSVDEISDVEIDHEYFYDEDSNVVDENENENDDIVLGEVEEIFVDDSSVYESESSTENETSTNDEDNFITNSEEEKLPEYEISLMEDESAEPLSNNKTLKYTYTISTVLAPFNEIFYVMTDDPNPSDIRFVDKNSVYYDKNDKDGYPYIELEEYRFLDVAYENKTTGRVKGGYIFTLGDNGGIDGGTLTVEKYDGETYKDTGIKVECPPVKDYIQYLVDTYTSPAAGFFENMDSIQDALEEIALYPRFTKDVNKKSEKFLFPMLTVSPYPELSLNEWYEMYEDSDEPLFLTGVYPYVLDSLSFPSAMVRAALRLDPSATYEWTSTHYMVKITNNGETHSYGGAGNGGNDPIYSNRVEKLFLFDGSSGDYVNSSLTKLAEKYKEYGALANEDAEYYRDLISGDTFTNTIGTSSWIRVGTEGFDLSYKSYAFVTNGEDFSDPYTHSVEDIWVDGRYINKCNQFVMGAKFSDYPTARIMMRDVTYMDIWGEEHHGDVTLFYDEDTDTWKNTDPIFADPMTLTRTEVESMGIDKNTNDIPAGLIYDGSAFPGTPYQPCPPHTLVTVIDYEPTCEDTGEKHVECTSCNYTESSEEIPALGHTWDSGKVYTKPTCSESGEKIYTCTVCKEEKWEDIPPTNNHKWGKGTVIQQPTAAKKGKKYYVCSNCGKTKTKSIPPTGQNNSKPGSQKLTFTSQEGLKITVTADANRKAALLQIGKTVKKSIKIPDKVTVSGKKYTITSVKAKAFSKCKNVTEINLPSSIAVVAKNSFKGAKKLRTIIFKSSKDITVKKGAFNGLDTKNMVIKVNKNMPASKLKKLKKSLTNAKFKGKVKMN